MLPVVGDNRAAVAAVVESAVAVVDGVGVEVVAVAPDRELYLCGMSRRTGGYNGYTYNHLPCPKLPKRPVAKRAILAACMAFSSFVIRWEFM